MLRVPLTRCHKTVASVRRQTRSLAPARESGQLFRSVQKRLHFEQARAAVVAAHEVEYISSIRPTPRPEQELFNTLLCAQQFITPLVEEEWVPSYLPSASLASSSSAQEDWEEESSESSTPEIAEEYCAADDAQVKGIEMEIREKLNRGKPFDANQALENALRQDVNISVLLVKEVMDQLTRWPRCVNTIFDLYTKDRDPNLCADLYRPLCMAARWDGKFIPPLLEKMKGLNHHNKSFFTRRLLMSLVEARLPWAAIVYRVLVQEKLSASCAFWEHVLTQSKFQPCIPFYHVLAQVVAMGGQPQPETVSRVVTNCYPFDEASVSTSLLRSIIALQRRHQESDVHYKLDSAIVEAMAMGSGSVDVNHLIWEYLHLLKLQPTEGLYETSILAFLHQYNLENALLLLAGMKEAGHTPSRSLIRSMSKRLRGSARAIDFLRRTFQGLELAGKKVTVEMVNIAMSSAAERGDISRIDECFKDLDEYGLQPNGDSFSFALEALVKSIGKKRRPLQASEKQEIISQAEDILASLESSCLEPTHHILHEYVALLCLTGERATATEVVSQCRDVVSAKSLFSVATSHIKAGNFGLAKRLVHIASDKVMLRKLIEEKMQNR